MGQVQKLLDILKVELLDAEEDLKALIAVSESRVEQGQITNYVFLNNAAVLRKELASVVEIVHEMDACCKDTYSSLEEAHQGFLKLVDTAIQTFDYPQAVRAICERKIQKVRAYLET